MFCVGKSTVIYVIYIVHAAKVERIIYIASDLLKTLREFNNISPAIFLRKMLVLALFAVIMVYYDNYLRIRC